MNGMTDHGSAPAGTYIDQRIEYLEELIRELRHVKALLPQANGNNVSNGSKAPVEEPKPSGQFSPSGLPPKARQLWDWTKAHGPVTRKDIKDKSGVSAGTIANYLNAQHGFRMISRGLWDVEGVSREQRLQ